MTVEPAVSLFDPSETAVRLRSELMAVREQIIMQAQVRMDAWRPMIVNDDFLDAAANLANYLALRSYDLRHLQKALSSLGLSSLGRSEGRVLPAIDAVLASLTRIAGTSDSAYPDPSNC